MAIPQREQRLLQQKSGNRCAFPGCRRPLTAEASTADRPALLGEMAHIVAERPDGPRGDDPMNQQERNTYANLILLCNTHHQLIDDQSETYTVERLHRMKEEHETWVETTLGRGIDELYDEPPPSVTETLHSTLLPVERVPRFVFGAPCFYTKDQLVKEQIHATNGTEIAPFILRQGMLFAFQDLRKQAGPFTDVVDRAACERYHLTEWVHNPVHYIWLVNLFNRVLNKLTGRCGLYLDKLHHRYYFPIEKPGQERKITYQPLNQKKAEKNVVWQPKRRRSGEGIGFWYHRAVALQFVSSGDEQWCVSIRPEFHITQDGMTPYPAEKIGKHVTRKKSHMHNYEYLGEVHFWRDFLSNRSPRIIFSFGGQQKIVISTTLLQSTVTWPGIPEKFAKQFKNVAYPEDLFTLAELRELEEADDMVDEEEEDWDFSDEEDLFEEGE
ncbi:MAG: HNH endonuclease [Blastochloris sp.]|nr:HNH endonuclease [Blastochloris sp.]